MNDLFTAGKISPMLIGAEREAFDSPDYLYELKLDGVRCLAYLDPNEKTTLGNKRNLLVSAIYPELSAIHKQVKGRCILDGELVVISNGRPEFAEIQRRALMSDPFKIRIAAGQLPVSFTAFDILYADGENLLNAPLEQRKEYLSEYVRENARIAVSRVIQERGKDLYALTVQQGLEGIVAKRKGSLYYPGRRTNDWIKCKNLKDEDFVVCGYIRKNNHMTSIILGQYRDRQLIYKGHVTLGISNESFHRIQKQPRLPTPPFDAPAGNECAIWINPALVCTVKYMEKTTGGALRQPVFKGLRDDKAAVECVE